MPEIPGHESVSDPKPSDGLTPEQQAFFFAGTLACIDSGLAQHYHRLKRLYNTTLSAGIKGVDDPQGVAMLTELFDKAEAARVAEGFMAFSVRRADSHGNVASIRLIKLDLTGEELPNAAMSVGFVHKDGRPPSFHDDFTADEFAQAFDGLKRQQAETGLIFAGGADEEFAWVFARDAPGTSE